MKRYIYKIEDGSYSEVGTEIVARISPQPHWIEIPDGAEFAIQYKDVGNIEFRKGYFWYDGEDWVIGGFDYDRFMKSWHIDIIWESDELKKSKGITTLQEQETDKPKYLAENTKLFVNGVEIPCVEDFKFEPPECHPLEDKPFNPLDVQEGGSHYKQRGIQPIEYTEANKLNFQQGNVVKYITRHKEKNGVEDLGKVVHYALLEAYFTYGIEGSTKLKQKILKMLGESN